MRVGSLPHRLFRLPLALVRKGRGSRVLSGPLRGAKWITGSSTHGCWLGIYEWAVQARLCRVLEPGAVFYDVGANVGFYTLLASRLVGPTGRVVAIEPLPRNVAYLRRHLDLNGGDNVVVVEAAVSRATGRGFINVEQRSHLQARLEATGTEVEILTLDSLLDTLPVPAVVKIDVEGAEGAVLEGATTMLARRPRILLAAHGWEAMKVCIDQLEAAGYVVAMLRDGSRDGDYAVFAEPKRL